MNPNSHEGTMFNQSSHHMESFLSNPAFPNSEYNYSTLDRNLDFISNYNPDHFNYSNNYSNISNSNFNELDSNYNCANMDNFTINSYSESLISHPNSPQLHNPSSGKDVMITSALDTASSSEDSSSHELESETIVEETGKIQSPASEVKEENPKASRAQSKGGGSTNRPPLKKPKRERGAKLAIRIETDVDVVDDGYKWRKYGQKPVKNSPYPRSYYKCTDKQCKVKKHVERQAHEPAYVVMTYEGVHNHPRPDQQLQALQQTQNIISSYQDPFASYFDQLQNRQSVPSTFYHPSISQYKPGYVLNNNQHNVSNISNNHHTSSHGLLEDLFYVE